MRTRANRRGVTSIEFAVIAPVFFLIILGIVEIGRGLMVETLFTNAARTGVRHGIIEGTTTAQITTTVNNLLVSQGISGDVVTIEVNDGVADASSAQSGDEITVLVSAPISKITWVPYPQFLSGSISAQYTMRRE